MIKEILCYECSDGRYYKDKDIAIKVQEKINNREIIDNRQIKNLEFKINDIVYVCSRNKIRQCKVLEIEDRIYEHDENSDEIYTQVSLEDINDKEEGIISFWTSINEKDLNEFIKLNSIEFFNFYDKTSI